MIRGNVKDEEGAPLPGVTVMIKGTTMGVSTDAAGNFVLDMPDGYQVLQFSFIGMETQEVKLGGTDTQVNVVLKMAVGQWMRLSFPRDTRRRLKKEPRVPWPW